MKTNSRGEIEWQQTYGGSDDSEQVRAMIQTADGGFALAGSTASYGAGSWDMWLVKIAPIPEITTSTVVNPITLFIIPYEFKATFGVVRTGDFSQKPDFQLGENVSLVLDVEMFRGGDFPHIASDIIFVVTNESGDIVWNKSIGPVGIDASWEQVDSSGNPVQAGSYAAGVRFVEPTYDFPKDFIGVIPFTILNGTSVFVHSNQDLGSASLAVAVGDIDNDGDLDLIFGNRNGNNTVYRNDGDGTFTSDYVFGISSVHHSISLRLGDLDGDGDLDLVDGDWDLDQIDSTLPEVRIYENGGRGDFSYTAQLMQMPSTSYWDNSQFIELADIDNDGDLDIIISLTVSNSLEIFLNNGGDFVKSQTLDSPVPMGCAVGDIDNDGDLDLVIANSDGYPNRVFNNKGSGVFVDTEQCLGEAYTYSVALGDIENDGDLDLIAGNIYAPNELYVNNGIGIFTLWQAFGTLHGYSHPVVLGDIDNDKDLDMITGGDRTYVYLNDGTGRFEESEHCLVGTWGWSWGWTGNGIIALADINNDWDLDLITTGRTNKLYINTLFTVADSDGDGLLDGEEMAVYKTDPLVADSDGDGLLDGEEVAVYKTDPLIADSDGDTYLDGEEVEARFDPNDPAEYPTLPLSTPQPLPPTTGTIEPPTFFIPGFASLELLFALACIVVLARRKTKW